MPGESIVVVLAEAVVELVECLIAIKLDAR